MEQVFTTKWVFRQPSISSIDTETKKCFLMLRRKRNLKQASETETGQGARFLLLNLATLVTTSLVHVTAGLPFFLFRDTAAARAQLFLKSDTYIVEHPLIKGGAYYVLLVLKFQIWNLICATHT